MEALDLQHGGINILRRCILDIARPIGVVQGRQRFRGIAIRGRHTRQEQRLAIPTQRILQQTGELALAIRHVLGLATLGQSLFIGQGIDYISQCQQSFINLDSLPRPLSFGARLLHPLTTGKVHKGKARGGGDVNPRFLIPHGLLQMDGEDGMRPTALMIHQRGGRRAMERSDVQNIEHLGGGGYRASFETNDADAAGPILSEGKRLAILVEEVVNVLPVNLEEGCRYVVMHQLAALVTLFRPATTVLGRGHGRGRRLGCRPALLLLQVGKHVRHESRDQSNVHAFAIIVSAVGNVSAAPMRLTAHGKGLSRSSLTVCHDLIDFGRKIR